jgi:hypothetical protein
MALMLSRAPMLDSGARPGAHRASKEWARALKREGTAVEAGRECRRLGGRGGGDHQD